MENKLINDISHDRRKVYKKLMTLQLIVFLFFVLGIQSINASAYQPLSISTAQQQQKTVSGNVIDQSGVPMPGVSVLVKGTATGTVTDNDGKFVLEVPADAKTLVFSFLGMKPQEVVIDNTAVFNIKMAIEAVALQEFVAIGYGTQAKKDLTGSVASIKDDLVKNRPVANLNEGLVGQIPGVDITINDALPGGETAIKIRGIGSIGAGNEPLYVVDGFPTTQAFANAIDPSTIQSLDVLKDASATAIYGSRGSNGVILITTKSGVNKAPQINFNSSTGVANVAKRDFYHMLNGKDYVQFTLEALNNGWVNSGTGRLASDPNSVRLAAGFPQFQIPARIQTWNGVSTDWQDAIFNPAFVENYNLNVTGGSDNVKYLFSAGYLQNNGVVVGTGYQKYTAQIKVDANLYKNIIQAGMNLVPAYSRQRTTQYQNQNVYSSVIGDALGMPSDIPVHNADGTYGQIINPPPGFVPILNPVQLGRELQSYNYNFSNLINTYIKADVTKDIELKTTLGATLYYVQGDSYYPSTIPQNGSVPSNVGGNSSASNSVNWLSESTVIYNKIFLNDHKVNFLLGYSVQKQRDHSTSATGRNYPNDIVQTLNAAGVTTGSSSTAEWSLISYYARLNYTYLDKYLLTGTVRRDGSSVFGANNKYGTFPSGALGWVASNEDFLKNNSIVSFLKLRLSYGISGNNNIGNYSSIGLLSYIHTTMGTGAGTLQTGILPSTLSLPGLKWEKSAEFDIGLDLNILKDRISMTADYYNRHSSDLLLSVPLPTTTGFGTALQNLGKVQNKGIEFSVTSKNLTGIINWSTTFNIAHNKNKVISLGPTNAPISGFAGTHVTKVGGTVGANYGLRMIGVLTKADISSGTVALFPGEHPGDPKYFDTNGDGVISNFNGVDAVDLGQVQPSWVFGFNNTLSFKNFDLNILTNGQTGGHIMDLTDQGVGGGGANANYKKQFVGRYISDAQPGNGRVLAPGNTLQGEPDTRLVLSSDYFRIKNIAIGYNFPASSEHFYKSLRIFLSVENAITWKTGAEYNPQATAFGSAQNVTIDGLLGGGSYPLPRTYSLGVNITL